MKRVGNTNKFFFAFFLAALLCAGTHGFSADIFNANLSVTERGRLASGEILIRSIDKAKNMALNPVNPLAAKTIDAVKRLNPNYLVEVIQVRPYRQDESLVARLGAILADVPAYRGIPYWAAGPGSWYDLYERADERGRKTQNGATVITAEFLMDPFEPYDAQITVLSENGTLFYSMENIGKLKTDGITVVKEHCMNSVIIAFRDGGSLVLYGIGGVKAPSLFVFRSRIERSFVNRIKTFCMYVYEKL
jgi:hypothetical protein